MISLEHIQYYCMQSLFIPFLTFPFKVLTFVLSSEIIFLSFLFYIKGCEVKEYFLLSLFQFERLILSKTCQNQGIFLWSVKY